VNGTGFMQLVLEENVDLLAARCPYFLERCVGAVVRAAVHVVNFSSPAARPQRQPLLTSSSLLQRVASQATSRHASFDVVWKALRLIRGVPSEVVANISDRLGAGVLELIRLAVPCMLMACSSIPPDHHLAAHTHPGVRTRRAWR
jgi:hypothetical protein